MTVGWKTKDGRRWQQSERVRVARRFRGHVRTPSNPRGRIHRESCHWHPDVEAEFHHIDYANPWRGAWLGLTCGCHRRVEHGTLRIPAKAIWDYTSLIESPGVGRPGGRRHGPVVATKACTCPRRTTHDVKYDRHQPSCPKFMRDPDAPPF